MILNMWVRLCLVFVFAGVLLAQIQMNVEQLKEFVRSSIAMGHTTDKQLAAGIRQIQLTEKLTDAAIIDIQTAGPGQKTVEALKALRDQTADMKPPAHEAPATAGSDEAPQAPPKPPTAPPPSPAKQGEILQAIKDYAENYTKSLPNFFCVEVTRQFVDPNGAAAYRNAGTILAKLGWNEGKSQYKVYSINGKLVDMNMDDVKTGGATSTGEFYHLMQTIFDPHSETDFHWDHWAKLRDRRMAIFNYAIDHEHSIWNLEDKNSGQSIRTAYKGLIYADPATGEIDRITFEAVDLPKSFPINKTTEILDYDLVEISGNKFVLPLTAKLFMKAGRESSKNEIEFRMFRKFEADSFIKYDLDPNAPPPSTENKNEEPPKTNDQSQPSEPVKPAEQTPAATPKKTASPWDLPTLPPPPPPK